MNEIPRNVSRDDVFDWQFEQVEADQDRADDLWRGVEWTLARTPQLGSVTVLASFGANGPFVRIYATVTEELARATHIEVVGDLADD